MKNQLLITINKIENLKAEIRDLVAAGDLEGARIKKENLVGAQKAFDILKEIEDEEEPANHATPMPAVEAEDGANKLANAFRNRFMNAFTGETVKEDGGYLVPEDIQTSIQTLREASFSLASLVNVENVTTEHGRRTFRKRAQHAGFAKVGEGGKIGQTKEPKFGAVEYTIDKYAGYLPVSNELFEDSDQNITNVLSEWLAAEDVATRNKLIVDEIAKKTAVAFKDIDDIKKAINVTLGSAFAGFTKIITNDDGLQYLDTLKDTTGRSLLSANANGADPIKAVLAVGVNNVPVVVVPNAVMPTKANKIPFVVGDLGEYVTLFDRKQITLKISTEAAVEGFNAFESDMTLIRGIVRLDAEIKDADAIVSGYIIPGGA